MQTAPAELGFFERWPTLWVLACIGAGIGLGQLLPAVAAAVAGFEFAKVDFGSLHEVRRHGHGIGVTLVVNWAIKPFSMALLAWIFIRHLFADWLPAGQHDGYIAGLILLAAAPCTAMVFVWSNLAKGEPNFTLTQVALNDFIIVALLLGVASIQVPWETLLLSVLLYIVVPLAIAQAWRRSLLRRGAAAYEAATRGMTPWSIVALLATIVLLFAFQGDRILAEPLVIALLAVPILIQVVVNSTAAYLLNRRLGVAHCVAGPSALIGASNSFELAVAVAISLFGLESGAALATVVGVLIEVPLMLAVVRAVNTSKRWYEAGLPPPDARAGKGNL